MYSEQKQAQADTAALKRPAVLAISGVHNSGKTTLLEKLLPVLRSRGLKVGVIKHDGHDFTPDVPGTDSYHEILLAGIVEVVGWDAVTPPELTADTPVLDVLQPKPRRRTARSPLSS